MICCLVAKLCPTLFATGPLPRDEESENRHQEARWGGAEEGRDSGLVVVHSLSCVWFFATPWTAACHASFPVLHYFQEFAQIHVHWVGDAIQPFHPLLPPSPFVFNLSQDQGLFQWVVSSHLVAKVLVLQLQHQSFQKHSGLIFLVLEKTPESSLDCMEINSPS